MMAARLPGGVPVTTTQTALDRLGRADAFDLSARVAEWLRFQGPIAADEVKAVFGFEDGRWSSILEPLLESRTVVLDELTGRPGLQEICDAENLEILLRWLRQEQRPQFEPRPVHELPLFLAEQQGLTAPSDGLEGLQDRLEQLFGLPLPAGAWETEVLPARLDPYYPSWLDSAMQQSDLCWLGCGKERVTFGFDSDLELFFDAVAEAVQDSASDGNVSDGDVSDGDVSDADLSEDVANSETEATDELLAPLELRGARFSTEELIRKSSRPADEVEEALWEAAWQGKVSNDTWIAVRQGVQNQFQPMVKSSHSQRKTSRAVSRVSNLPGRSRIGAGRARARRASGWRSAVPRAGSWMSIDRPGPPQDALEAEEQVKDRVRLLLSRYGVLFRELVKRELPVFQWSRVFRTLRLMELSGEVLAGYFFVGPRGLQFMAHGAFRRLSNGTAEDVIYGLNAADPASLCGVELEGLKGDLPSRLVTTHLVYHGHDLVLVSKRRGKDLDLRITSDHPRLDRVWGALKRLITREVQPLGSILVEQINGEPAAQSPFAASLGEAFRASREGPNLRLWKRYSQ